MEVAGIPLWGQLSIVGALVSVAVLVVVAILRGDLITKREQDRRDAKHAAELESRDEAHAAQIEGKDREIREWRSLWQSSQDTLAGLLDGNSRVTQALEVFERFIQSLPSGSDDHEH